MKVGISKKAVSLHLPHISVRQKHPGTNTESMQSMGSIPQRRIGVWDSIHSGSVSGHFAENKDLSLRRQKKDKKKKQA